MRSRLRNPATLVPANPLVAARSLVLLALLFAGHAMGGTSAPTAVVPDASITAPTVRPDWPHGRVAIATRSGRRHLAVDIADTPERQELGLMDVRMLPRGLGMLFPVDPPGRMQMWMKDTYLSLDMVFIGADGRIACIREHATPQSLENINCPHDVRAVLEVAGGMTGRLGIRTGDQVELARPNAVGLPRAPAGAFRP